MDAGNLVLDPIEPILIIEADPLTSEYLTALFAQEGGTSLVAPNGATAIDALDSGPRFSAILLDPLLPDMDGFWLLTKIRQTASTRLTPIIIITSRDSVSDRVRALRTGANDYMTKPFETAELKARLGAVLYEKQLREELEQRLREKDEALKAQRKLARELEIRNSELARVSELKNQFISLASHDLRNPLANIKGYADLLHSGGLGDLTPDQKSSLEVILRNCSHLLETLAKLLDVSCIDAGEFELHLEEVDLRDLAAMCIAGYEPLARAKSIALDQESHEAPVRVVCDRQHILGVMNNLVSNAIKFCSAGDRILVCVQPKDGGGLFTVRDSGPGIPTADQEKLFQRFAKLTPRPTGGEKSVGLGLALVKEIAELHGGHVTVETEEGVGSVFSVFLDKDVPESAKRAVRPKASVL